MASDNRQGRTAHLAIVASTALTFALVASTQSFAGCGGYCEAQNARAICHDAVRAQGLKAQQRDVEFDKCKADPASYAQPYQLTNDAQLRTE